MPPKLFIGIPCYEERDALHQTIGHIRRNTATPFVLHHHVAKQSVVANKNALLPLARASGADYVCLCDDDVEPLPGWDTTLIASIEEVQQRTGRRVGQTSPLILYPDGSIFNAWNNVWFDPVGSHHGIDAVGYQAASSSVFRCRLAAGALPGTLTIFHRDVLEHYNWSFDAQYEKSQYEDVDQSLACRAAGFISLYNGHAEVVHHTQKVAPRAATANYDRLIAKWKHRVDLSRVVEPTEEAARVAEAQLFSRRRSLLARVGSVFRLMTDHPARRTRTAFTVLQKTGIRGLAAYLRTRADAAVPPPSPLAVGSQSLTPPAEGSRG